jgi:hypothetical protein
MTNAVKEWDLAPTYKEKLHGTALHTKMSADGLLTKPKQVTWKTCISVVEDCVFLYNIWIKHNGMNRLKIETGHYKAVQIDTQPTSSLYVSCVTVRPVTL